MSKHYKLARSRDDIITLHNRGDYTLCILQLCDQWRGRNIHLSYRECETLWRLHEQRSRRKWCLRRHKFTPHDRFCPPARIILGDAHEYGRIGNV